MVNKERRLVSLFSGSMGLDLGLEQAGFTTVVANEIDKSAVETIRHNRSDIPVNNKSIADLTVKDFERSAKQKLRNCEVVAGGPPCQAFSVFGNRKGTLDSRGELLYEFVRVVDEIRPKTFVMENVRGLHSMPRVPKKYFDEIPGASLEDIAHGSLFRDVIKKFNEIGYRVDAFLVNVVNYGGPQIRERIICIGNKYNLKAEFPTPRYSNRPEDNLPSFRTLGDVIGEGFVDTDPSLMNFSPRKLKYLAMVPPGGNWRSLPEEIQKESMGKSWYLKGGRSAYWRKLSFDFPSPTVVTMPNHAGTSMCHPTELRAITVGEAAAIQEFPPDWQFVGSPTEKFRMIGNAVPVRLGFEVGNVVDKLLLESEGMRARKPSKGCEVVHLRPHVRTKTYFKAGQAYAGSSDYYSKPNDPTLPLFDDVV